MTAENTASEKQTCQLLACQHENTQSVISLLSASVFTAKKLLVPHKRPRTTYLCTTSPLRMLSKWPWKSHCGDYWQQAELRT